MRMTQLILQHRQQIRNHAHSLLQQTYSLVHLQVTPHSLINRVQLRLCPHEFRSVQDGPLKMDVDAQDEELANLHVNFSPGKVDAAGAGDCAGYRLGGGDGGV